jgi:hypothetical protein
VGKPDTELGVLVELEVGHGVYAGPEQCPPLLESRVKNLEWARRRFDCDTVHRLCDLFLRDLNASMSAFGTKRTYRVAPHMSAIGGKADMTIALRNVRF